MNLPLMNLEAFPATVLIKSRSENSDKCESSPTLQALRPHLQGAAVGLVKPKLMRRCQHPGQTEACALRSRATLYQFGFTKPSATRWRWGRSAWSVGEVSHLMLLSVWEDCFESATVYLAFVRVVTWGRWMDLLHFGNMGSCFVDILCLDKMMMDYMFWHWRHFMS
jgi:hypothetical protein